MCILDGGNKSLSGQKRIHTCPCYASPHFSLIRSLSIHPLARSFTHCGDLPSERLLSVSAMPGSERAQRCLKRFTVSAILGKLFAGPFCSP